MSEHLLKVLLSELTTVRVRCNCGHIVEMQLDHLAAVYSSGNCPLCRANLQVSHVNGFCNLAQAVQLLLAAKDKFQLEFVLPVQMPPSAKP